MFLRAARINCQRCAHYIIWSVLRGVASDRVRTGETQSLLDSAGASTCGVRSLGQVDSVSDKVMR